MKFSKAFHICHWIDLLCFLRVMMELLSLTRSVVPSFLHLVREKKGRQWHILVLENLTEMEELHYKCHKVPLLLLDFLPITASFVQFRACWAAAKQPQPYQYNIPSVVIRGFCFPYRCVSETHCL